MRRARAPDDDRARFAGLESDVGEDPARFLDGADRELVLARVRGIDHLDVLNAWLAVENRLHDGRPWVVDALEARRDHLETHGVRDLSEIDLDAVREQRETAEEDEAVWQHEACGSTDVEQESSLAWYCNECEQRTNRVDRVVEEVVAA